MQAPARNPVPLPNKAAETALPPALEALTDGRSGSDFMVDCIKSLGFEYMAANPASSFRGLHESLINYGGNTNPEFLTCRHEEISVAMGHGYYKIEGKPLCIFAHGTVGLQHATMALYNAWCDRVPVYVVVGNIADAQHAPARRRVEPHGAGRRRDRARLREVGRLSGLAAAFRRIRACAPTRSR